MRPLLFRIRFFSTLQSNRFYEFKRICKLTSSPVKVEKAGQPVVGRHQVHRLKIWTTEWEIYQEKLQIAKNNLKEISVVLPDGKKIPAILGFTTPLDIAKGFFLNYRM